MSNTDSIKIRAQCYTSMNNGLSAISVPEELKVEAMTALLTKTG